MSHLQNSDQAIQNEDRGNDQYKELINSLLKETFTMDNFQSLIADLFSGEKLREIKGAIGIRKLLSVENNPPIQAVIDHKCIAKFLEFLERDYDTAIQLESAWSLTNIASGTTEQALAVVNKGSIPAFVKLVDSASSEVADQCLWALGNFAGDGPHLRDLVLKHGGLAAICKLVSTTTNRSCIKNGIWAISNLCRGKPLPSKSLTACAIPVLVRFLEVYEQPDNEVLTDCLWAISYLSDGDNNVIQQFLHEQFLYKLAQLLNHMSLSIKIPALRTIGNLCTGDNEQTEQVLKLPGLIDGLFQLLNDVKKSMRKEAAWVLSNVACGTTEHLNYIFKDESRLQNLFERGITEAEDIAKEIFYVVSNVCRYCDTDMVHFLLKSNVLEFYKQSLQNIGSKGKQLSKEVLIEGLDFLLKQCRSMSILDEVTLKIEEIGLVDILEELEQDKSVDVYKRVVKLLEEYFELEDDDDEIF